MRVDCADRPLAILISVKWLRNMVCRHCTVSRRSDADFLRLSQGYEYREAVDGLEGVQTFETDGHFEYGNSCPPMGSLDADCCFPHFHCSVVLVDLSMPILDGVGATARMREIESKRKNEPAEGSATQPTRILALTGMSSLEDKRRAFEAGVDG